MRYRQLFAATLITATLAPFADGQESVTYETDHNGVTYKVTRRQTQQLVPQTQVQTREEKVLRPRVTTTYQTTQQSYLTPVTEYRWVARMRGRWNPFADPYWTHQLEPTTRWESRPATVQTPVTNTEWVEERRTVQTPVTTYRTVPGESITKVAVSVAPGSTTTTSAGTMVATRPAPIAGGERLMTDIPRQGTQWRSQGTGSILR